MLCFALLNCFYLNQEDFQPQILLPGWALCSQPNPQQKVTSAPPRGPTDTFTFTPARSSLGLMPLPRGSSLTTCVPGVGNLLSQGQGLCQPLWSIWEEREMFLQGASSPFPQEGGGCHNTQLFCLMALLSSVLFFLHSLADSGAKAWWPLQWERDCPATGKPQHLG